MATLRVHGAGSGGFNGAYTRTEITRNGRPVWEKPEASHKIEYNGFEWRMFSASSPEDGECHPPPPPLPAPHAFTRAHCLACVVVVLVGVGWCPIELLFFIQEQSTQVDGRHSNCSLFRSNRHKWMVVIVTV
jgi:hypothetical protein